MIACRLLSIATAAAMLISSGAATAASVKSRNLVAGSEKVGGVSAGWACLPSGRLHARDFVDDDADMADIINSLMTEKAENRRMEAVEASAYSSLRIDLVQIKAKLCAKSYGVFGLGDKKSMSGKSQFTFNWEIVDGMYHAGNTTIEVISDNNSPMTTRQIFRQSIKLLLDRHILLENIS